MMTTTAATRVITGMTMTAHREEANPATASAQRRRVEQEEG